MPEESSDIAGSGKGAPEGACPDLTESEVVPKSKLKEARDYAAQQAAKYAENPRTTTEYTRLEVYTAINDVLGKAL
ncbi:hypothetical protein ACIQU6_08500 [Streptomyces sp. NPDC090442]|uniref:hypothetical protein n=1 Tax=Streptomyces sp. NPDC090442 TaxID=3365962 RepID=UPI0038030704